jgi:hypothetical protein
VESERGQFHFPTRKIEKSKVALPPHNLALNPSQIPPADFWDQWRKPLDIIALCIPSAKICIFVPTICRRSQPKIVTK